MELLFILFIVGLFAGMISAIFGVGGGVIIVPALYTLFPTLPPSIVISTSLGNIFLNALLNTYNFYKADLMPSKIIVMNIGIFTIIGSFIGSYWLGFLNPETIKIGFASFLILIIINLLFFHSEPVINQEKKGLTRSKKTLLKTPVVGLLGGLIAATTGLGGGAIMIPLLISWLKTPMTWVSPYSNAAMIFATGSALVYHSFLGPNILPTLYPRWQVGHTNLALLIPLVLGVLITSRIGIRLSSHLSPSKKRYLFALILSLVSLKIFISS